MGIQEEYLKIKADREFVRVEEIHEWAKRHPESAFHQGLDWDDASAGYQHRLWQIRRLIAVHIISSEDGRRQTISLSIDRTNPGGGYRDIDQVMAKPDLADIAQRDAMRELERTRAKYGWLKRLNKVWREIEAARDASEEAA